MCLGCNHLILVVLGWYLLSYCLLCCVSVIPFKVHPHMSIIIVSQLLVIIIVSVSWLLSSYSGCVWLESYLYWCLIPSIVVNYSFHCCHLFLPLLFGWNLICIVVLFLPMLSIIPSIVVIYSFHCCLVGILFVLLSYCPCFITISFHTPPILTCDLVDVRCVQQSLSGYFIPFKGRAQTIIRLECQFLTSSFVCLCFQNLKCPIFKTVYSVFLKYFSHKSRSKPLGRTELEIRKCLTTQIRVYK